MRRIVMLAAIIGFGISTGCGAEISSPDSLDAEQIPSSERFTWQPREVVAVIGSHRWRSWGPPIAVAISPDGKAIASGGQDGIVRLWDLEGRERAALDFSARGVSALAFRPDGQLLLAGDEDGLIRAWDLNADPPAALDQIRPSELPKGPGDVNQPPVVDAIAFTPNGKLLAQSVGRQTGVRVVLWDSTEWPPQELPALPGATAPFAFGPDGKTLITQERSGDILVWDLTGERPQKKAAGKLPGPRNQMLTMAMTQDGETLATCHGDSTPSARFVPPGEPVGDVILWDLTQTPPKPKAVFGSFKFDPMYYMTAAAAFDPNGKTLAFAGQQRHIELWDVTANPPKQRTVLPGTVQQSGTVAFALDGKSLASVGDGVILWNLAESTPRLVIDRKPHMSLIAMSPDGRWLASVETAPKTSAPSTRLWTLTGASPQPLAELIDGAPLFFADDGSLVTAEYPDESPTAPEPSRRPNSIQAKATLRRWDVSKTKPRSIGAMPSPPGRFFQEFGLVAATTGVFGELRPGEFLFSRLGDGSEAKSSKLPAPLNPEFFPMAMSVDGTVFAAGVGDWNKRHVQVWDLSDDTAREKATFTAASVSSQANGSGALIVWCLALTPDGKTVALAVPEGTIQVWNIAKAEPRLLATLGGHKQERVMGAVQRIAFSSDGRRLVSVGSDRKLMVWDVPNAEAVYTAIFPGVLNDAAFTPDGRHVITINPDGTAYVLRLPPTP